LRSSLLWFLNWHGHRQSFFSEAPSPPQAAFARENRIYLILRARRSEQPNLTRIL
jgi:hypothetical protein